MQQDQINDVIEVKAPLVNQIVIMFLQLADNLTIPNLILNRQQKHAPDIHNDDYFPVLGASAKRGGGGGGWSTAAPGGAARDQGAQRQPLALGNRFTSLQDDS